jgi:H+/Cl- antiporter ClcA
MKKTIEEESILFISIVKWLFLASLTGALVGFSTSIFLKLLKYSTDLGEGVEYTRFFLPVAILLSVLITKYLAPSAKGHGTEKVIDAVHNKKSIIPLAVVPVKLVTTIITIATGGSAGKEGPCAQIGAGLASSFAQLFKFNEKDRKKLVICGISAGFSAVFGTPIAGAIFGVEVLFVGSILYDVLLPSFVAGIVAFEVASFMGIEYSTIHPIDIKGLDPMLFLKVILASIAFGLISMLLIKALQEGHRFFEKWKRSPEFKAISGGLILLCLSLLFGREYLGLGVPVINACLEGGKASWYSPFLKILFTSITLSSGGSGGILTPIFFIGSTSGAFLAPLLNVDVAMLSSIGFVCLLAGAANTPIAASIMAIELFGPSIGPYSSIACVIAYLMTGHRSVFPSQIIAVRKSSSLNVDIGQEVEKSKTSPNIREGSLTSSLLDIGEKVDEHIQNVFKKEDKKGEDDKTD